MSGAGVAGFARSVIASSMLLSACDDGRLEIGNGPWLPAQGAGIVSNDSTVLDGADVGWCASGQPPRRTVPVTMIDEMIDASAEFELGTAYLVGLNSVHGMASFFLPVKNVGTATRCGISLLGDRWRDARGNVLETFRSGPLYVFGSVRFDGVQGRSCLAAGETGLFMDTLGGSGTDFFRDTFKIEVGIRHDVDDAVVRDAEGRDAPAGSVVPVSYAVSEAALRVMFKNVGRGPAEVGVDQVLPGSAFLILDHAGLPIAFSNFTSVTPALGTLAPGDEGFVDRGGVDAIWDGCGPHVWTLIAFDPTP